MAGYGAQKAFGWFDGSGLDGTSGWLTSTGYRPARLWAALVGPSEFGGGARTALGLLHPLGPIATVGSIAVATLDLRGKPIWAAEGGAELPITNIAAATAVSLTGAGTFSLDRVLGIHVPTSVAILAALGVAAGVVVAERQPKLASQASSGNPV